MARQDGNGDGEPLVFANEFAFVEVRKRRTRNGERLEIRSPRIDRRILLDPMSLEALTWQPHNVFSEFLETPFGPEGDDE